MKSKFVILDLGLSTIFKLAHKIQISQPIFHLIIKSKQNLTIRTDAFQKLYQVSRPKIRFESTVICTIEKQGFSLSIFTENRQYLELSFDNVTITSESIQNRSFVMMERNAKMSR